MNYSSRGNDIFITQGCPYQEIIVDTFTVINPDDEYYFIFPGSGGAGIPLPGQYSTNIQHGYVEQADQDVYVSPDGDNNNSGLSESEPLQSISFALVKINADSLIQRTVHIADGVYSVSQNNQVWPMQIKSYINIVGESRENTILDAELTEGFFKGKSGQKNYSIENLSLLNHRDINDINLNRNTNVYINNIYMANSELAISIFIHFNDISLNNITIENCHMGGIYYYSPNLTGEFTLQNIKLRNNYANVPLYCYRGTTISDSLTVNIINSEITDNVEICPDWLPRSSAVKVSWSTKLNLINSTIGNNASLYTGAAVLLALHSEANIVNSIVYGNEPYNLGLTEGPNTLTANNSLIGGGQYNQLIGGNNYIYWHEDTMLDEDPLWLGTGYEWPYALSANSPCIDTGTLDLPYGVELPAYDLAGNPRVCGSGIDMGAYEFPGIAAPINLEIYNATLYWQLPTGYLASGFNIYLDEEYQTTLSSTVTEYTFTDLIEGHTYIAGVSALYGTEETVVINLEFIYDPVGTEVEIPISQIQITNYPNPFNPDTKISLFLPESGNIKLEIFNVKGQKVKTLIDAFVSKGKFETTWNCRDISGKKVASGEYFAKLKINGEEVAVRKMLLLK